MIKTIITISALISTGVVGYLYFELSRRFKDVQAKYLSTKTFADKAANEIFLLKDRARELTNLAEEAEKKVASLSKRVEELAASSKEAREVQETKGRSKNKRSNP